MALPVSRKGYQAETRMIEVSCRFHSTPEAIAALRFNSSGSKKVFDTHEFSGQKTVEAVYYYDREKRLEQQGVGMYRREGTWYAITRLPHGKIGPPDIIYPDEAAVKTLLEQRLSISCRGANIEDILYPREPTKTSIESYKLNGKFEVSLVLTEFGFSHGVVTLAKKVQEAESVVVDAAVKDYLNIELEEFVKVHSCAFPGKHSSWSYDSISNGD